MEKRRLTERQAWLELARHFSKPDVAERGICHRLWVMGLRPKTMTRMEDKVYAGKWDKLHKAYRWPLTTKGHRARARFCRLQARRLVRGKKRVRS
jgi:hypothetical protein